MRYAIWAISSCTASIRSAGFAVVPRDVAPFEPAVDHEGKPALRAERIHDALSQRRRAAAPDGRADVEVGQAPGEEARDFGQDGMCIPQYAMAMAVSDLSREGQRESHDKDASTCAAVPRFPWMSAPRRRDRAPRRRTIRPGTRSFRVGPGTGRRRRPAGSDRPYSGYGWRGWTDAPRSRKKSYSSGTNQSVSGRSSTCGRSRPARSGGT